MRHGEMKNCPGILLLFWKEVMTSFFKNLVSLFPLPDFFPLLDLSVPSPVFLDAVMGEFLISANEHLAVTHWGWLLPGLPSALLLLFPEWFAIL